MHLRRAGIGKADVHLVLDQRPDQTLRTVHRSLLDLAHCGRDSAERWSGETGKRTALTCALPELKPRPVFWGLCSARDTASASWPRSSSPCISADACIPATRSVGKGCGSTCR